MAESQSDKSRFQSKYGGGYVSDAQYLAEFICERIAQKEKTTLPYKFWNSEKWSKMFMQQLRKANAFLKIYSIGALLEVLRENPTIYSLMFPRLHDLMNEKIKKWQNQKKIK